MELFSIASGSSGNCVCVGSSDCHVMIDAGISGKRIEAGMNAMGLTVEDMEGVLVTHEHSDHIAGLGVIARKYGCPIYATAGTIEAIRRSSAVGSIDEELFHPICPEEAFSVGAMTVYPMGISHDAADPVAYLISEGKKRIGVVTDLGCYNSRMLALLQGLDALLLEANHDINMLQVGSYPYPLKQRILGDKGHLSNESSGQLLGQVLHDHMKHVLLGHLSKENNYPQLAYETVRLEVTLGDNPYRGSDFPITVAPRSEVSERIEI